MISRFLHRLRGHVQETLYVTPPLWDLFARGELIRCSCHKTWVR